MSADLALRARARRRRRRDHAGALPRARPARRDEARPDAGVARPTAPPRRRSARSSRASAPGEGVLGEEFGDDGDRRALDRRPDRRHEELRPRRPRVGHAARARARGPASTSAVVSAPALGRRWWAVRGEGALGRRRRARAASRRSARIEDCVVSTTTAPRDAAGLGGRRRRAWAIRGFGDFWQHCLVAEGAVDVAADPELSLWDYAAVQLLVEEAGGRCTTFAGGAAGSRRNPFLATNGAAPRRRARAARPLASGARGCADRLLVDRGRARSWSSSALSRSLGECSGLRTAARSSSPPSRTPSSPAGSTGRIARPSRDASQPRSSAASARGPRIADLLLARSPASSPRAATRQSCVRAHAMSETAARSKTLASSP